MFARTLALLALSSAVFACSSAPGEETGQSDEDLRLLGGFPPSYYQIDTATPVAGDITLLSLTATTFWAKRCADDACVSPDGISGTYKRSKTRVYLFDGNGAPIGTFAYTLHHGTLTLRETKTSHMYALDPMSESLCDASGGAWSDDDLATHGFNCACPNDGDWGPTGCPAQPCHAPDVVCNGSCVDLATDRQNCGACSSYCTKAQSCVNGTCQ